MTKMFDFSNEDYFILSAIGPIIGISAVDFYLCIQLVTSAKVFHIIDNV